MSYVCPLGVWNVHKMLLIIIGEIGVKYKETLCTCFGNFLFKKNQMSRPRSWPMQSESLSRGPSIRIYQKALLAIQNCQGWMTHAWKAPRKCKAWGKCNMLWSTNQSFDFLRFFFLRWTIFKVFIECVTILLLLFRFWIFGWEACEILASLPGIKLVSSALEGEVFTTRLPGKLPNALFLIKLHK